LSKEKLYNTAYLSLTRGDGGQNLIGPEIREALGIIRTYELLGAREIDGGKQFFSRAVDFGYSKTAAETFTVWDSVQVLSDVVWVIRQFKPDVIITRFSTEPGETHGHHTASAILAEVGSKLASDPNVFPEQLEYVSVWKPKKLYWNTSRWFYGNNEKFDTTKMVTVNVGGYSPLLGKSYTEIAAKSRSMHRSQGFGASTTRGDAFEYLIPFYGSKAGTDIFEGIDTSWKRVEGGEKIGKQVEQIKRNFNPEKPATTVTGLLDIRKQILSLSDSYWKNIKLEEVDELIKGCLGLFIEATTNQYSVAHQDELQANIEVVNRSDYPIILNSIQYGKTNTDTSLNISLFNNQVVKFSNQLTITDNVPISQPFWLAKEGNVGMFDVEDPELRVLSEAPPPVACRFSFTIMGQELEFEIPLVYKRIDPAVGEVYRPLQIIPAAFTKLDKPVYIFTDNEADTVKVVVKSGKENLSAQVKLEVPYGYDVTPQELSVSMVQKGQETIISFVVTPPDKPSMGFFKVHTMIDGKNLAYSWEDVKYDHIPEISWFPESKSKVLKLDLKKKGELIGYVAGAGDAVAESLELVGYNVKYLTDSDFNNNHLKQYDAIIFGIRAFNVNNRIKFYQAPLMNYIKNGGVVIVQYNVNRGLVVDNIAPLPLRISRDRITDEKSTMEILDTEHKAMNFPNRIVREDFDHWVQERGLYFADQWDDGFIPILSTQDPGEEDNPKKGGLLVAKYGKGYYVYTGYSWFRQLPAGVPGAFRIFTNLISLGAEGDLDQ
jgi:LmbE family N-acetylglucosaminyl deacetylase